MSIIEMAGDDQSERRELIIREHYHAYIWGREQNDSSEKTRDNRGDVHSIKADISSPIRRSFSSPVKSAIAISINLRTGCKGRRARLSSLVREEGGVEGTRYSGLVAQVSRRGIISEG